MKFYQEPAKKTPIAAEVDVLVVGGGPAGFSAAVNASRSGAKTMLIELAGQVGGMATTGLMSHWTGSTQGGFYEEILDRSHEDPKHRQIINPEILKFEMLKMLNEENVELRLYTMVVDVIMEGNKTVGVITESKSGREAFMAEVVIDGSGDGDIAAKAGVPYYKGREDDGKMQPVTIMFKVAGVDTERALLPGSFETTFDVPGGDLQTLAKEHIPHPAGHVLLYRTTLPGVITCNMTNSVDIDGTSAEDLTKAEYVCRSQIPHIVSFLRKYVPGFEECYVIASAANVGVRETRHFHGEYMLTEEDILSARKFDDWVVTKAHFNFDVHSLTGPGLDETGMQKEFPQDNSYTIPYGCLLPQKVEGLLLAGRNISGTHMAHSNFRVMPICANIGQAAGVAAALAVKHNGLPRRLDVGHIQAVLKKQGVDGLQPAASSPN
ncbi:MAG: FAD-dependent oxidoreductase [Firmicutes bacterium]|nr:FAD-dependent oxidoreductase [Bacillota bacterium]